MNKLLLPMHLSPTASQKFKDRFHLDLTSSDDDDDLDETITEESDSS
jgi:hypothetical protein